MDDGEFLLEQKRGLGADGSAALKQEETAEAGTLGGLSWGLGIFYATRPDLPTHRTDWSLSWVTPSAWHLGTSRRIPRGVANQPYNADPSVRYLMCLGGIMGQRTSTYLNTCSPSVAANGVWQTKHR